MYYLKKILILCVLFSSIIVLAAEHKKPEKIVMTFSQADESLATQWLRAIYSEAFDRIGIKMEYEMFPANRANKYANEGKIDGILSRVRSFSDKYTNLVRVDEHHYYVIFSAFSYDKTIELDGWDSLKNTSYNVEYRLGLKKPEGKLTKIVDKNHLSTATKIDIGIKKLKKGRTDVYIDSLASMSIFYKSETFKKLNLERPFEVGVMERLPGYAFINKKYSYIIPELEIALRQMKEDGTFDKTREMLGIPPNELLW